MYWDDFLDDLERLAGALDGHTDTERTGETLRRIKWNGDLSWQRAKMITSGAPGIEVPPPRNKAMHPRLCTPERAWMQFSFELGERFDELARPHKADFQVRVEGCLKVKDNRLVELQDHWRVDSHAFENGEDAIEPHPYFHFQRGGHAQEIFAGDPTFVPGDSLPYDANLLWRGLMQSSGPRIPMAPHCPILAIDFTIGQHNGNIWRRLRSDRGYLDVVRRAQQRLWTPFFNALMDPRRRSLLLGPVIA